MVLLALIVAAFLAPSHTAATQTVQKRQAAPRHDQGLAPGVSARAMAEARHLSVRLLLGRSYGGRPIEAIHVQGSGATVLVVGCVHGNECEGTKVTRLLLASHSALDLWVVPNLNPDGFAARSRGNAHGVDLNRDFGAFTQRETRIARKLILRLRPTITIWFHQPQGLVRGWGNSRAMARRYARLAGAPYRSLQWPSGAATRWQNGLGLTAFVVELPPGALPYAAARRHARAVVELAQ
jgi:protein MpaA